MSESESYIDNDHDLGVLETRAILSAKRDRWSASVCAVSRTGRGKEYG